MKAGVTKTPPKQVDPYELARLFMKFSVEGHQISMELPESCVHVQIFMTLIIMMGRSWGPVLYCSGRRRCGRSCF